MIHSTWCSIDVTMFVSTDGLPGPGDGEQVGEAGDGDAEVRRGCLGPLVAEAAAVAAAHVDPRQRTGHRVEAGRVDDGVELEERPVAAARCPSGTTRTIGFVAQVDEATRSARLKVAK